MAGKRETTTNTNCEAKMTVDPNNYPWPDLDPSQIYPDPEQAANAQRRIDLTGMTKGGMWSNQASPTSILNPIPQPASPTLTDLLGVIEKTQEEAAQKCAELERKLEPVLSGLVADIARKATTTGSRASPLTIRLTAMLSRLETLVDGLEVLADRVRL